MGIKSFEDVLAWQKGKELYLNLYMLLDGHRNYSYKDQLLRATLSITNNIAEGFDRGTNKELRQFLIISRGSAAEVRSMLVIAAELDLFPKNQLDNQLLLVKDISKLLTGFTKSLN